MRRSFTVTTAGLLWLTLTSPAAAQESGNGHITARLFGRVQFQFNSTSVRAADLAQPDSDAQIAATTFETRRVRMGAHIEVDDWITAILDMDFANAKVAVRQAYMTFSFDPRFEVRLGQFKKAFGLFQMSSSQELPIIERGLRIRGLEQAYELRDEAAGSPVLHSFKGLTMLGEEQTVLDVLGYHSFDLGAAVHGRLHAIEYEAGIFNGAGPEKIDSNGAKSYAGHLRWHAPGHAPLVVGTAVSYHEVPGSGAQPRLDGTAFEADVELGAFRRPGPHLLAEATTGSNFAAAATFRGAQGVLAWYRAVSGGRVQGLEPLARVSWADPDHQASGDEGVLLTPGVNLYFEGHNRLMLDWDVYMPSGDRFHSEHALRFQAQVSF